MFELFKKYISELLLSFDINLQDYNYKKSKNYEKFKNIQVFDPSGRNISLEMFIDRYLLFPERVYDTYKSKFDMGSQYEFYNDDCEDIDVADEIILMGWTKEDVRDADAEDLARQFYRSGGLISRLKTYLDFDLEAFEKKDKQYKYERCKILYLFYTLENIYFKKTNVLKLLSKPSMENIDNSPLGTYTYNGMIIKLIKDSLEKELSLTVLQEVQTKIRNISNDWDSILNNARILMDFFYKKDCRYDFDATIQILLSDVGKKENEHTSKYMGSPIETLYLKIVQLEYLGNVTDISLINNIQKSPTHNAPPEFVEEMKKLHYSTIDINDIENYINENALRISKYVYLKPRPDKEEVRRIRNSKHKIHKWLNFCRRARPLLDIKEISNELQIISFLQAVILDDSSEKFDYVFYGYESHFKHMPNVQAALKNEKHMPDALQCYWIRKVADRWYANLGRYDERIKLRELERACDSILKEILNKPTLDEMIETHKFYLDNKVDDGLMTTAEQIDAVQNFEKYLLTKGFNYNDNFYLIRYAFLYPPEIKGTYECLSVMINSIIVEHTSPLELSLEVSSANGKDMLKLYFELDFDYETNECTMQNFELNDQIKSND